MYLVARNTRRIVLGMNNWLELVKSRMKELEITQEALAEKLGFTQGAIAHWLSGRREPGLDTISKILKELRMPPLLIGVGPTDASNVREASGPYRAEKEYPLISNISAGTWMESCDNFHPGDAEAWISSSENAGPHGYWLRVDGPSMEPRFVDGMLILVKPEGFDLISGKFYVAKLLDSGETTFKQYIRDAGTSYLSPLNKAFRTIEITEKVAIIGRVIDYHPEPSFL
jgi:SOS-response transcriptional repressor LexA